MRYYVDCLLTSRQRAKLVKKELDFSEVTVGSAAYRRHGVTFSTEDASAVLAELGLIPDLTISSKPLSVPGREEQVIPEFQQLPLMVGPSAEEPLVMASCSPRSKYDVLFAQHADRLELGVVLSEFRNTKSAAREADGVLFVNFRSAPEALKARSVYDYAMGTDRYTCPRNVDPKYLKIIGKNRKVIALFQGDKRTGNLWLLVDPNSEPESEELVDYVLTAVERHIHPKLGPPPSYREFQEAGMRRRYMRQARQRLEEEQNSIDQHIEDVDQDVAQAREGLVSVLTLADAMRRRREILNGAKSHTVLAEIVARLEKEFDSLANSPEFQSITFDGDVVVAATRPITIKHKGKAYKFGRYKIEVGKRSLRITSVDKVKSRSNNQHCHPHVSGGKPCLGNLAEGVARMQAGMEFELLLPLLVQYLEVGYNSDDSYSKIGEFNVTSRKLGVRKKP